MVIELTLLRNFPLREPELVDYVLILSEREGKEDHGTWVEAD